MKRPRYFDAGTASGNSDSPLTQDIARAMEALGLESSAVHAGIVRPDAAPNDFVLAMRVRHAGEALAITLRIGLRIRPDDRPLDARVISVTGPDGEPVEMLVFPDATVSVRRDH